MTETSEYRNLTHCSEFAQTNLKEIPKNDRNDEKDFQYELMDLAGKIGIEEKAGSYRPKSFALQKLPVRVRSEL